METKEETGKFYDWIEHIHNDLMHQLLSANCNNVEFIRGKVSAYENILKNIKDWKHVFNNTL
jgi:hypothetical protein